MMPSSPLGAPAWVATERFMRSAKRVLFGAADALALAGFAIVLRLH